MRYLSVCSGIEAASVSWEHMGWVPVGFSEVAPFPSAVLSHRFPHVQNFGDLNGYKTWPLEHGTVDLVVGGTPCQSFSVAGLKKGFEDPRGNLALVFLGLVDHLRPRYVVWENVPGVLWSNGGRDFGSLLGGLGELGYGWAYRVLDAQYFGVPQRRKRLFLVGCAGAATGRAAEVLSIAEGMRRHPAPSREERKSPAGDSAEGSGECVFDLVQITNPYNMSHVKPGLPSPTLCTSSQLRLIMPPVADPITANEGRTYTHEGNCFRLRNVVPAPFRLRRLTPTECERLQGFPDGWTDIPWKGRPSPADAPRYRALGNSMPVPVMRWIGEAIRRADR